MEWISLGSWISKCVSFEGYRRYEGLKINPFRIKATTEDGRIVSRILMNFQTPPPSALVKKNAAPFPFSEYF